MLPYAKYEQSKIINQPISQSNITGLDKCAITLMHLLGLIGKLDSQIETTRIELSGNSNFYIEALFAYLKNYHKRSENMPSTNLFKSFFDFSDADAKKPVIYNIINGSKDGIIEFQNIIDFLKDTIGYHSNMLLIQQIQKQFHVNQYQFQQNQVMDGQNDQYPLPSDVQKQVDYNRAVLKQQQQQGRQQMVLPQATPDEVLNSGRGFNFNTFQRIFLSQSIPNARVKVLKRKLIYETQDIEVTDQVKQQSATLLKCEIDLFKRSEELRVQLSYDPLWNPLTIFQALDIDGQGELGFQVFEQAMIRAQQSFKPKDFQAIVRRAHLLSHSQSQKEILTFEDFKQLTAVYTPFFKQPGSSTNSTFSQQQEFSRILGGNVGGSSSLNNQSLGLSRLPDKVQAQAQSYIFNKPTIPLYFSKNQSVNEIVQKSNNKNIKDQNDDYLSRRITFKNQFVVYGTKKEWEELQHSLSGAQLGQQASLVEQISRIQNQSYISNKSLSQIKQSRQKVSTRDKTPPPKAEAISGEANWQAQKQQFYKSKETREVYNAKNANTQGYRVDTFNQDYQSQPLVGVQQQLNPAPWQQIDRQTELDLRVIRKQQDEIKNLSGYQQSLPISPQTQPSIQPQSQAQSLQQAQRRTTIPQHTATFGQDSQQQSQRGPPIFAPQSQHQQQQQEQQQSQQIQPASRPITPSKIFEPQHATPYLGGGNKSKVINYNYDVRVPPSIFS